MRVQLTSRYYGHSIELLDAYAWYQANSQDHAWSCGSLLPNDLGLFDMLGNICEWCQDKSNTSPVGKKESYSDDSSSYTVVIEKHPRIMRGGTFSTPPENVDSAGRYWYAPAIRSPSLGFRLSRTLP